MTQAQDLLFLDGVYVERPNGWVQFRWVKAPTSAELTQLTDRIARRVVRSLERQGLLERDAQNSYLAEETLEADPMEILSHSAQNQRQWYHKSHFFKRQALSNMK